MAFRLLDEVREERCFSERTMYTKVINVLQLETLCVKKRRYRLGNNGRRMRLMRLFGADEKG